SSGCEAASVALNQWVDDFSLMWIASVLPTNWTESGWASSRETKFDGSELLPVGLLPSIVRPPAMPKGLLIRRNEATPQSQANAFFQPRQAAWPTAPHPAPLD